EILLAGRAADWAPVRHADTLHDRASYRFHWQVLRRARRAGQSLPGEGVARFFAARGSAPGGPRPAPPLHVRPLHRGDAQVEAHVLALVLGEQRLHRLGDLLGLGARVALHLAVLVLDARGVEEGHDQVLARAEEVGAQHLAGQRLVALA